MEFMTQKCDKDKEITEFTENCKMGNKLYKNTSVRSEPNY